MTVQISGWGRYPVVETELLIPHLPAEAISMAGAAEAWIARGNGRAYGDAGIGSRQTLEARALNRIRAFNATTGFVTVEAGLLLGELISVMLPRGFFPFVVPGTQYVTVGGALAADVHGKNHHGEGGFGDHVDSFVLATPATGPIRVSRTEHPELFAATVGGMGLTGLVLEVTLKLRRVETGWIRQQTYVADNLSQALRALEASNASTYSVAWIDCLAKGLHTGRSLIFVGEHASADEVANGRQRQRFPLPSEKRLSVPFDLPGLALNSYSMRAFNELYFRAGSRKAAIPQLVPLEPYFFPLDGLKNWNRIYGRSGFVQHQCVIPEDRAETVLASLLDRITAQGNASFLAVLKKLGAGSGLLSFPLPGYTLALDFAVRPDLFAFLDDLDRLIAEAGGRLYLAKDARQSRGMFEAGYGHLTQFRSIKKSIDENGRIRSHLSERLGI